MHPRPAGEGWGEGEILLLDQAVLNRVADGCVAGFDTEFPVNRTEVRFNGTAADDQALGDLGITEVLREQAQHGQLARGQGFGGD